MKKVLAGCLVALLCAPLLVQAQTYKCKRPNGTSTYQDQPCEAGTVGDAVNLPPVSSIGAQKSVTSTNASSSRLPRQQVGADDAAARARNAEIDAANKAIRCNNATRNLGVLKEQRPVFHYDKKGERQYVEDANRPAMIAEAERRVAEACR